MASLTGTGANRPSSAGGVRQQQQQQQEETPAHLTAQTAARPASISLTAMAPTTARSAAAHIDQAQANYSPRLPQKLHAPVCPSSCYGALSQQSLQQPNMCHTGLSRGGGVLVLTACLSVPHAAATAACVIALWAALFAASTCGISMGRHTCLPVTVQRALSTWQLFSQQQPGCFAKIPAVVGSDPCAAGRRHESTLVMLHAYACAAV